MTAEESASQHVTRILGTDDWVIVYAGREMVTDEDLDEMEVEK